MHKYHKNCLTHKFHAETVSCIRAAETSNCMIANETVTCMIATQISTKITVTENTIYIDEIEPENLKKHVILVLKNICPCSFLCIINQLK